MSETAQTMALKPMSVLGYTVTRADLVAVVYHLTNVPDLFTSMDLVGPLPAWSFHWQQEVANRLMQRWRKLGLVSFKTGRWRLSPGAWDKLQSAARMSPTSETDQLGGVGV